MKNTSDESVGQIVQITFKRQFKINNNFFMSCSNDKM